MPERLLFLEVEVTISLSNLLKQCFVVNSGQGIRVIDSNGRMNERLNEIGTDAHMPPEENSENGEASVSSGEEFAAGIEAPKIDVEEIRQEAVAAAQEEADHIIAEARAQADQMLEDANADAQRMFEEQKDAGYQEGVKIMEAELEQKRTALEEEYQQQSRQLADTYEQKMTEMEGNIVDAVIQVFDKVFQIQFEDKREILLALITNMLMDVESGNKIRIRANKDNISMLREHSAELQDILGQDVAIEFVHDNKLQDGQCQIETTYGVFDCGIDTQLSNLMKDLRSLV
jgi:flagellar assembly protein FliH